MKNFKFPFSYHSRIEMNWESFASVNVDIRLDINLESDMATTVGRNGEGWRGMGKGPVVNLFG